MIKGGIKATNKEIGKVFTSKIIPAIDANIKLNQELFSTVEMMANIKIAS